MQDTDRVGIIGAGASGLTVAKNLKELGLAVEVLERSDVLGGNWIYGNPFSSVYRSAHLISSKQMSAYLDFPFPPETPDYPNHVQVADYLRAYAEHFNLRPLIRFNTCVEHVQRAEDGAWQVALRDGSIRQYSALVIANGHHWDPQYPSYAGTFTGEIIHAHHYKTPDILRNKRVLVVGAGNSGCDIAVESSQNAQITYHSTRRGYWYIPKFVFGIPTDQVNEFGVKLRLPLPVRQLLNTFVVWLMQGRHKDYGLPKPNHRLLEAHPIVNSQLLYFLRHGDILPKPDIAALEDNAVRFVDGSSAEVDIIIYATGYKVSFPFMDRDYLNWGDYAPKLWLHVFHPQYDNLFVAGLIQPDSGQFWLVDYQAQLIGQFLKAQRDNTPGAEVFRRLKAGPQPRITRHNIKTPRHALEIDHGWYRQAVRRLLCEVFRVR